MGLNQLHDASRPFHGFVLLGESAVWSKFMLRRCLNVDVSKRLGLKCENSV